MTLQREEDAGTLFDFCVEHPEGWVIREAQDALDWSFRRVREAIRALRLILGDDDSLNLTCDPQGSGEQWLYQLVGNLEMGGPWVTNRLQDTEARLETIDAFTRSMVKGTDGRSVEGRKARLIERSVRHLLEDLRAFEA